MAVNVLLELDQGSPLNFSYVRMFESEIFDFTFWKRVFSESPAIGFMG